MALETGTYLIRNDGILIGRRAVEDKTLLPKIIVKHDKGFQSVGIVKWDIKKVGSGDNTYILKSNGSYTVNKDGEVYGFLEASGSDEPPQEWVIEAIERPHGKDKYTITVAKTNKKLGWVAPKKSNDPIACQSLMEGLSLPLSYTRTELFEIVPWQD